MASCAAAGDEGPYHASFVDVWEAGSGKRICSIRREKEGHFDGIAFAADNQHLILSAKVPAPGTLQLYAPGPASSSRCCARMELAHSPRSMLANA